MESLEYIILETAFGILSIVCALMLLGKPPKPDAGKIRQRIHFMDFVKGAAIVAVIALHAVNEANAGRVLNDYIWFGVPLFILVSGYLLGKRYEHGLEVISYVKKFFFRVVGIYSIFFSIAYFMNNGLRFDVPGFFLDWLLGRIGNYYFIPLIVQLYLIFLIINKHRQAIASWWFLLLVFCASLAFRIWDTDLQNPDWNTNPFSLVFFGRFAFYFVFGICLSQFEIWKIGAKKTAAIAVAGFALIALRFCMTGGVFLGYFYPVLAFFSLHSIVHTTKGIPLVASAENCLAAVGRNSLVIYLAHGVPLYFMSRLIGENGGIFGYFAIIGLTLAISYAISVLFVGYYWLAARKFFGFHPTQDDG